MHKVLHRMEPQAACLRIKAEVEKALLKQGLKENYAAALSGKDNEVEQHSRSTVEKTLRKPGNTGAGHCPQTPQNLPYVLMCSFPGERGQDYEEL